MVDCLTRSALRRAYELAGPRAYSLREMVDYVAKLSGRCSAVVNLGSGLAGLQVKSGMPTTTIAKSNATFPMRDLVCTNAITIRSKIRRRRMAGDSTKVSSAAARWRHPRNAVVQLRHWQAIARFRAPASSSR